MTPQPLDQVQARSVGGNPPLNVFVCLMDEVLPVEDRSFMPTCESPLPRSNVPIVKIRVACGLTLTTDGDASRRLVWSGDLIASQIPKEPR